MIRRLEIERSRHGDILVAGDTGADDPVQGRFAVRDESLDFTLNGHVTSVRLSPDLRQTIARDGFFFAALTPVMQEPPNGGLDPAFFRVAPSEVEGLRP